MSASSTRGILRGSEDRQGGQCSWQTMSIATTFFEAQGKTLIDFVKTVVKQGGFLDDDWIKSQCQFSLLSLTVTSHNILVAIPGA